MKIHKEGHKIVKRMAIVAVLHIAIIGYLVWPSWLVIGILVGAFGLTLTFIMRFFRVPARTPVVDLNAIVAPADGKVVVVEETLENEYLNERRVQISIFMSVWDVHINWYPIKGIVNYFKHHNGHFFVARHPKSSTENERTSVVVTDEKGRSLMIRQIAGAVARRIVCYSKEDKAVEQGKQMGFIKFGSRVDVFVPLDAKIQVKPGQHTVGSETILAYFD
ncbi:MAG: phosphatidylserine decarboxylase family protein [Bacteroidales bacterium]